MNLLTPLFFERFSNKKYYDTTGRSYVEYICGTETGYRGEICFFHFSLSGQRKNSYMNIDILKFIKSYYSRAYDMIYPVAKCAIFHDVVMTFNSFNEYNFLIKFQTHKSDLNIMIQDFIFRYTGKNTIIDPESKFCEIVISLQPSIQIEYFRVYTEKAKDTFPEIPEYSDTSNVFMTLEIYEIAFQNSHINENYGVLYKFVTPFLFYESEHLKKIFGERLSPHFTLDTIYLAFVEKMKGSNNDILYFTEGFSIPA